MRILAKALLPALLLSAACGPARHLTESSRSVSSRAESRESAVRESGRDSSFQNRSLSSILTGATETRTTELEAVPEERAEVTVAIPSLTDLPEGATYTGRSGRVSVEARRRGDSIVLSSTVAETARRRVTVETASYSRADLSDSMAVSAASGSKAFQKESESLSNAESSAETRKGKPSKKGWWFCAGLAAMAAVGVFIQAAWRRLRNTVPAAKAISLIGRIFKNR